MGTEPEALCVGTYSGWPRPRKASVGNIEKFSGSEPGQAD
jgi:hypothetical protein